MPVRLPFHQPQDQRGGELLALLSPHHQRIDDGLLRSLSDRRAPARRSQESQGSLPSRELVRIGSSFIRNPSAASAPTCHLAGIPSPRNPIRSGADPRQSGSRNRRCVPVASDCGIEFGSEIAGALRRDRVCLLLDGLAVRIHAAGRFASITYGITSALILSPLLWESTVRFQVLSPALAAAVTVAFVVLTIALAWRRDLQLIPWIATLASVITAHSRQILRN